MKKMSPIQTFSIALDIHAGRIPVNWTVRDCPVDELRDAAGRVLTKSGIERVFWPQVKTTKWGDTETSELEDPLDLRAVLFKAFNTDWSEKTALAFLNRVGAWRIVPGNVHQEWAKGMYANVAYRHRPAVNVRVVAVTLAELRAETEYWYQLLGLLGNQAKLKKAFKLPPSADARPADIFAFATEAQFNTLPVSLEWQGTDPRAVIEPITASELLAAAAWADVAGCVGAQVCGHCKTRFASARKKKYCRWECGHVVAVRNLKRKYALDRWKKKARKSLR